MSSTEMGNTRERCWFQEIMTSSVLIRCKVKRDGPEAPIFRDKEKETQRQQAGRPGSANEQMPGQHCPLAHTALSEL